MTIEELVEKTHAYATNAGFYDKEGCVHISDMTNPETKQPFSAHARAIMVGFWRLMQAIESDRACEDDARDEFINEACQWLQTYQWLGVDHPVVKPVVDKGSCAGLISLIATEVGELYMGDRLGDHGNIAEELADVVIRCADAAGARGIDLNGAIESKMAYNESRAVRHGKSY